MRVSGFMVPADKVVTCEPNDKVRKAMDKMLEHKIGAVVIVKDGMPQGIVTKTDLLKAYKDDFTLEHTVADIMSTNLECCYETMSRDQAARILEQNQNHHAIVINKSGEFIGLVSSWDITVECAKDDRAWPWNRTEDGRIHKEGHKTELGTSPTTPVDEAHISNAAEPHIGDSFRAYIDNLGYFD